MANNSTRYLKSEAQKNIVRMFSDACYRHQRWEVWSDFIVMSAISISNTVDVSNAEKREKLYMQIAQKYNAAELELFCGMFVEVVNGLERDPDQDFLGDLFMTLELGSACKGQFFTPYSVCKAMAAITIDDTAEKIKQRGWTTVNDPACGAGALLVAYANECRRPGRDINYQQSVLFTAQDIDMIAGCMCYIQLSLLGCPGYVAIADTLSNPCTSIDPNGLIPVHGEHIWYTPFYFRTEWHFRRVAFRMDHFLEKITDPQKAAEPEASATTENEEKVELETPEFTLLEDGEQWSFI